MNEKGHKTIAKNKTSGFSHFQFLKLGNYILLFICLFWSCQSNPKKLSDVEGQPIEPDYIMVKDLPAPLIAKYIDPDSVSPPVVVPLKGKPKVYPAYLNVHQLKAPEVVKIPESLIVKTFGQDGIPMPKTIPANGKIVPALQPKPISADVMHTRENAIYNIQFLSEDQGLKSPHVLSILEDSRGHIWFGTIFDGVFRYDGKNFFQYTNKEGLLINRGLISIIEDEKGNIWFGGWGGICYYDGQNFVHFTEAEGLRESRGSAIMEDSKGNIWFYSKDLYCYDGKNFIIYEKDLAFVSDEAKIKGFFADNAIADIMEDSRGQLWLASNGSGVMRFDGTSVVQFTKEGGLIDNYISTILEDSKGNIWFGSGGRGIIGKGLTRYTPDFSGKHGAGGIFANFTEENGLSGNRIGKILEDDTGNIWISTYEGGITRFDGNTFTHITNKEGLSSNSILSLIQDSKGNIWAGHNGGGVNKYKPGGFMHFGGQQGFSEFSVHKIFEDIEGNIWMNNWYNGVLKYNGENFTSYTEENGLLQNFTNSISGDSKGNLWFSARDKGICRFDGKSFTYYTPEQGIYKDFHWDILVDNEDNIWVASGPNGVNRLNPETGRFTHFIGNPKEGIGGGKIFEDKNYNLWFGGRGYLAKFNREKDQIDFVCQGETIDNDWVWVQDIIEDDKENLWASTGVSIFQIKKDGVELNNKFPKFSKGKQLPEKFIKSLTLDKNKNLWMATDANGIAVLKGGLQKLDQPDVQWAEYTKLDGLKSNGLSGSFLDSKDRIWLANSSAAVSVLDLNKFQLPKDPPENLELSYLEINKKHLDFQQLSDSSYRSTISFGDEVAGSFEGVLPFYNTPTGLELPYELNHLTFNFSATDWQAPHAIKYSYFMEGLDKEWSEPTLVAKADYRPVPYGNYTFKVKAIGQANTWTEPIEYSFTVLPPWWHTWWAYFVYAIITIGAIGSYIQRLRKKIKLKQEQIEIEQHLNQELKELNVANGRFVPHEFLDILGKKSLKELRLGDQTEAKMTVLFSDIRDYTGISENMSPEDNFKLINAFLGKMGPIIKEYGGFICLYTGDGIMALFKENHAKAVKAAIEMQKTLRQYNRKRFIANRRPINIGIGLNTGNLMLGVIGDNNRYDTSVVSDAVNTASRMEGLTKVFGSQIIVSEDTLKEMGIDSSKGIDTACGDFRFLGKVKVKGKKKSLKIYDFYDWEPQKIRDLKSETKEQFEKALEYYYDRKFGKAADLFKIINEIFPGDVASKYYIAKSVKYVLDGVDAEWNGVENFANK